MQVHSNISLKPYNTFGIDVAAATMVDCFSNDDVQQMISSFQSKRMLIIGGGSNLLFRNDYDGVVVRPLLYGMDIVGINASSVDVRVGAGMSWDGFVAMCVANGWSGVENLSYIPGNVGASPVQNVGAYGTEAANVITFVNGYYLDNAKPFSIQASDCKFGYRNSIFKTELKGKVIVTSVEFKLSTVFNPNLDYGFVKDTVESYGKVTLANVRRAVIDIRRQKLPDPQVLGSAGSFFKNPEVSSEIALSIKNKYPEMPIYSMPNGLIKIPAGWLIEKIGWKGRRIGNVGVHSTQSLVLVNYGGAKGDEIIELSKSIIYDVHNAFGLMLTNEVITI